MDTMQIKEKKHIANNVKEATCSFTGFKANFFGKYLSKYQMLAPINSFLSHSLSDLPWDIASAK